MKKVLFPIVFLFVGALVSNAQSNNQKYWEKQADLYLKKADRVINYYNQKTKTFSPQELKMMRTNPQQFTQLANAETQRYDAAIKQHGQIYNREWVKSFNTPHVFKYIKINGYWYKVN